MVPPPVTDFSSTHTFSFPRLLTKLGISLAVSTYQANKLILLRAQNDELNTHFRNVSRPMGIAHRPDRLAIGAGNGIWQWQNAPALAQSTKAKRRPDACLVPATQHVTGNVDVHELAWGDDDLWFVNTRFSMLCTLTNSGSFVPRWWPPGLMALRPDDRYHLNGLAMANGRPAYVTALGDNDAPAGWRANKNSGGVIFDVGHNRPVAMGLCMPHSPRWHQGKLWFLESGQGRLSVVRPGSGEVRPVVELPGFTRGLALIDRWAFVGLSQVRESHTFGNLPLNERLTERLCGVWVVDIQLNKVVGHVRFQGDVQEIFAVEILPGWRWPELLEWNHRLTASTFIMGART